VAPQALIRGEELEITNGATAKVREEEEERKRGGRKRAAVSWQASHADSTSMTRSRHVRRRDSGQRDSFAPCAIARLQPTWCHVHARACARPPSHAMCIGATPS
jgi:hypothetical protein